MIKLFVEKGYDRMSGQVVEVDPTVLPINIAPDMVCDELVRIPDAGEKIFLGLSERHLYPWNVKVSLYNGQEEYDDQD